MATWSKALISCWIRLPKTGRLNLEEVNPHLHGRRVENHLGKTSPDHPTEIRISTSSSSAVELNTTSALVNYATETIRRSGATELYPGYIWIRTTRHRQTGAPNLTFANWALGKLGARAKIRIYGQTDSHTEGITKTTFSVSRDPSTPLPIDTGFLVNSRGCRIPAMDPFDRHVQRFIYREEPPNCANGRPPPLVGSNLTALFVIESALPYYNVSDVTQLDCCYQPFWRVRENKVAFAKNCTSFILEQPVHTEFVKVVCQVEGHHVYTDYHAFIPLKPGVEKRCDENSINVQESVNVLILGVDAVSRLNLHRQMPKTVNFLNNLKAIEMLGYNKVGDNTFPNMVPVLSGLKEEELNGTCWSNEKDVFDSCPWIWKNFSDIGFRTAFGEDAVWMGIFNYLKRGFDRQPTDYYMRPYQKLVEDEIGHTKRLNAKLCIGSQMTLQVFLRYVSKFVRTMSLKRHFSFFWGSSLTHDNLNYPKFGDKVYEDFLRELFVSGSLNNTVLVFLSDHGIRWGGIRGTYQGRLEERLPFLFFSFPEWFRERYSIALTNMRRNSRRLTTPFDLHSTLKDLIDLQILQDNSIKRRTRELNSLVTVPRGISLFLPVFEDRTCEDAGIASHWCTCQQSKSVNINDTQVIISAKVLVNHLNTILKPYRECSSLNLSEVRDATVKSPMSDLQQKHTIVDYVLVVRTTPGDALFEATVRHQVGDDTFAVEGVVSRITTYGDQSACVSDYHMKLYCFCKSYLRTNKRESGGNHIDLGGNLGKPKLDSNHDSPVNGCLVYCESDALDNAATEVGIKELLLEK
uniref:(California timema) hypothetical protein n=1 Tax=Timema californicum TaxID=61474 RepID=A0A7R9P5J6_TIMCA|nr:unnamed protein product [Timema californicum]